LQQIAADCSRLQLLGRAPLPIRPDRHNQQRLATGNWQLTFEPGLKPPFFAHFAFLRHGVMSQQLTLTAQKVLRTGLRFRLGPSGSCLGERL